jgi:hypothetical protein
MEMFQKGEAAHLEAMNKMEHLMTDPQAMQNWMDAKQREFEALPED